MQKNNSPESASSSSSPKRLETLSPSSFTSAASSFSSSSASIISMSSSSCSSLDFFPKKLSSCSGRRLGLGLFVFPIATGAKKSLYATSIYKYTNGCSMVSTLKPNAQMVLEFKTNKKNRLTYREHRPRSRHPPYSRHQSHRHHCRSNQDRQSSQSPPHPHRAPSRPTHPALASRSWR